MNTYEITIKGTVYKTITVEAEDEHEAETAAHEEFDVASVPGEPEKYYQDTVAVKQVSFNCSNITENND